MSIIYRKGRLRAGQVLAALLSMATLLTCAAAAPAAAAPILNAELEREFPTVNRSDERIDYKFTVKNNGANQTDGSLVTAELELPAGQETYVYKIYRPKPGEELAETNESPLGWTCSTQLASGAQPARAVCTRSDALAAGASYPPIKVAIALGADAPDSPSVIANVSGGGSASASVTDSFVFGPALSFGISAFSTKVADKEGADYTQAGGHPFSAGTQISLNRRRVLVQVGPPPYFRQEPFGHIKDAEVDIPSGFIGNPQAVPVLCQNTAEVVAAACPASSLVGEFSMSWNGIGGQAGLGYFEGLRVYAIKPEEGTPAQFAFTEGAFEGIYVLTPRLRPDGDYALTIESSGIPAALQFMDFKARLCGYGAKAVGNAVLCRAQGEAGAFSKPFLTNQTECSSAPPVSTLHVDSWENPGDWRSAGTPSPVITGCKEVIFTPGVALNPTSHQAEAPTGLDVKIAVPSNGLEGKNEKGERVIEGKDEHGEPEPEPLSQGDLKRTVVTFPSGMSVNSGAADGLGACTQVELGMENGVPNDQPVKCPDSSKIGSAEVVTPLLEDPLQGSVYLAKQGNNPFHSLLALYLVVESAQRGILVKIPGKVESDPQTGRLVSTFDENPQVPFSSLKLHFNSGDRAPLLAPSTCGEYKIASELSPWSAPDKAVSSTSAFQVTAGPRGGACPDPSQLKPKLSAGVTKPVAGSTSPFVMSLSRDSGTKRFESLDLTLPAGLTAYLKGVPNCPQVAIDAAKARGGEGQGAAEIANPSCPSASQIGTVSVGVGGGNNPFYVNTGKVYLAGPYRGAPLSLVVVAPAVTGPFDLGTVVVRSAAYVNSKTAQITIKSDSIPTILHGIPLDVRDIRVNVDRPSFVLAPTNCEAMAVDATVGGEGGGSASVSNPFQVGNCVALGFHPDLAIQLHGGIKRGDYQRLSATVTAKPGEANIARAAVTFPHSAFLAQEHIRTVCTRVQFAAHACPQGSIYGHAEAITPLLDGKLTGPVYLRSSDNLLPDLVAALRGPDSQPIEIELAGRTDSKHGGIRNTFDMVPDAPVSKFRLTLLGGKKSLIVNSRNLCNGVQRATVRMDAQNDKVRNFRTIVGNDCGKRKGHKKHKPHAGRRLAWMGGW